MFKKLTINSISIELIGDYCFILTLEAQNSPQIKPPPYIPRKMLAIQIFLQNLLQIVDIVSIYW